MLNQNQIRDIYFETVAAAKAAGRPGEVCFVAATGKWYKFVVAGSALTPDDVTILITGVGGDTRWQASACAELTDAITDGDTTHAPDGNSVFDALALKVPTSRIPAAVADNDFPVGQASDGNWIKKTLAETKTILGADVGGIGLSFESVAKPAAAGEYSIIAPYAFTVPANCTTSVFYNKTNPTAQVVVSIKKNSTEFATLTVATNGTPTWASSSTAIASGDVITFLFPAQDATWAGVVMSLKGVRS
jgi:hypothetical protein